MPSSPPYSCRGSICCSRAQPPRPRPRAPLPSFPRHLRVPFFSISPVYSHLPLSLLLSITGRPPWTPRSSTPSLRPTPRRPCRRRRLGRPPCSLQELRADPAACRPPPPVRRGESPDPAGIRPASPSFARSRRIPDARSSGERRHKTLPPLLRSPPWRSSPLRLDLSTARSMLLSSWDPHMEVTAPPVSILPPSDPRRSSRDLPPVRRRLGPPRPAPRLTRRAGRPRASPSSGRTCGLGSPAASARARARPRAGQGHLRRIPVRRALERLPRCQGLFCKNETLS